MKYLTRKQLRQVLEQAFNDSGRNHAMLLVAYNHGLRASEVCQLTIDDVDRDLLMLTIRRGKNSLSLPQPISDFTGDDVLNERRALKLWLRERSKITTASKALLFSKKSPSGYLTRFSVTHIFEKYAKMVAGDDKRMPTNIHCLKHSRGMHCVESKQPIAEIRKILGHRSIANTLIYADVTESQAIANANIADRNASWR